MRISPNHEEPSMTDENCKSPRHRRFRLSPRNGAVIDAGLVTVNGVTATLGSRVKAGDKLMIDGHRYQVPDRKRNSR